MRKRAIFYYQLYSSNNTAFFQTTNYIGAPISAPNSWNCRCDVVQPLQNEPTPQKQVYVPANKEVPPIISNQPRRKRFGISKSPPYYEHVPEEVLDIV